MLKSVIKSRTVQFAMLLAVLSVLQGFVMVLPLSHTMQAVVGCVIAVAIVILRAVTTKPLLEK